MTSLPVSTPADRPPSSRLDRLCSAYVGLAARRGGLILLAALALGIFAGSLAKRLELRTDLAELLPESHPSVAALRKIAGRQKSATNLVLIVDSPDPVANRRFFKQLKTKLDPLIPGVFSSIQWRPDDEVPRYAAKWKWLYAEKSELEKAENLLDRILARRKLPVFVDLEGDAEAELSALRRDLDSRVVLATSSPPPPPAPAAAAPAPGAAAPEPQETYFSARENGIDSVGVMLWRQRDGFATMGDKQTFLTVQGIINDLNPASFHPQMKVNYTGHIALALGEQRTVQENITLATLVCIAVVMLTIYLYFRRVGMLLVVTFPALYGVLLALMLAQILIKYLNINTAFLVSIIIGNGINTPIVLLARYGEERRAGRPTEEALATAMARTMLGTGTAMLAASIAYGSLTFTDFRGFSQFGVIGAAGMILVWITTMLLVPPLVLLVERIRPGVFTPKPSIWHLPFALLGRLLARWPIPMALLSVCLFVAALLPLRKYAVDPLEWNFNNLRSDPTESEKLWGRADSLGMGNVGAGYIGNDGVLLVDSPEQADIVAEAMRKQDQARGDKHTLSTVRTLNSALPTDQDSKLAILARIREKLDRNRSLMDDSEWQDLQGFRPPEYLRRLTADDLPRLVLEAFTESDGQRGRLIGIDADFTNYAGWNGHDLIRLSESLTVQALGKTWVAASAGSVFAGMVDAIHRDAPKLTKIALFGVVSLVVLMFGLRGALPVLFTVAVGMTWLLGALGLINLKLNFMNFVTMPITLGVGADYAANIWARLRVEGPSSIRSVITDTGSAVALCSATTIVGYSTLLLASNRALRSFGLAADIGEVTCLVAAATLLPALAVLSARRRSKSTSGGGPDSREQA